jgi:hypothetical protein
VMIRKSTTLPRAWSTEVLPGGTSVHRSLDSARPICAEVCPSQVRAYRAMPRAPRAAAGPAQPPLSLGRRVGGAASLLHGEGPARPTWSKFRVRALFCGRRTGLTDSRTGVYFAKSCFLIGFV